MPHGKLDFVIAGVQKGGTTSLAEQLATHPDIVFCRKKEPHFFSKSENPELPSALNAYWSNFPPPPHDQVLYGEASTSYTFVHEYPDTAQRLFNHNPNMKVIIILRHPVKRIISHIYHRMRGRRIPHGDVMRSLRDNSDYVDRSRYFVQLKAYYDIFPHEQIKIIRFDDLHLDEIASVKGIIEFIGVEPLRLPPLSVKPKNISDARVRLKNVPLAVPFIDWLSQKTWAWRITPYIPMKTTLPKALMTFVATALIDDIDALAKSGWIEVGDWQEEIQELANQY